LIAALQGRTKQEQQTPWYGEEEATAGLGQPRQVGLAFVAVMLAKTATGWVAGWVATLVGAVAH